VEITGISTKGSSSFVSDKGTSLEGVSLEEVSLERVSLKGVSLEGVLASLLGREIYCATKMSKVFLSSYVFFKRI
jgi:hypothetical protein